MTSDQRAIALVTPQCTTTSMIVAEAFGKRHNDVLRAIETMVEQAPELTDERKRNFALTFTQVAGPNGATRQSPVYTMSRDGFSLLAMGFTGKKALTWKIAFIEAFNAMEQKLRDGAPAVLPQAVNPEAERRRFNQIVHWRKTMEFARQRLADLSDDVAAASAPALIADAHESTILTDNQADALRDRICAYVRKINGYGASKSDYGRAFAGISAAFGVTRYYRIPRTEFENAMKAVEHAVSWTGKAHANHLLANRSDGGGS